MRPAAGGVGLVDHAKSGPPVDLDVATSPIGHSIIGSLTNARPNVDASTFSRSAPPGATRVNGGLPTGGRLVLADVDSGGPVLIDEHLAHLRILHVLERALGVVGCELTHLRRQARVDLSAHLIRL